jgi:hypothetical protein
MYFSSKIEIDPTQITLIKAINQASVFQTLFSSLIDENKKYEQETFSAITILDQIHDGLEELKINNTIRLAVDNINYFIDLNSEDDDLFKAIATVRNNVDPYGSKYFENIFLVLEHLDDNFKYVIEIRIKRTHKVSEYPIKIHINALINDFEIKTDDYNTELDNKLKNIFTNQESYDDYVNKKKQAYDKFVKKFFKTIGKKIKVDGIKCYSDIRIIRPISKIDNLEDVKFSNKAHSIFYGYPNFLNNFYYATKWLDYCFNNQIKFTNLKVVDSIGFKVLSISDIGIICSNYNTFNTNLEFEPFQSSFVKYFKKNQYINKLLSVIKETEDSNEEFYGESYSWLKTEESSQDIKMRIVSTRRSF